MKELKLLKLSLTNLIHDLEESKEYKEALIQEHYEDICYAFNAIDINFLEEAYNREMSHIEKDIENLEAEILKVETKIMTLEER